MTNNSKNHNLHDGHSGGEGGTPNVHVITVSEIREYHNDLEAALVFLIDYTDAKNVTAEQFQSHLSSLRRMRDAFKI